MLFGQEMKQKLRILVLASSNAAVDIIAKRLLHIREKMESGMCEANVVVRSDNMIETSLIIIELPSTFQRPKRT